MVSKVICRLIFVCTILLSPVAGMYNTMQKGLDLIGLF